VLVAARANCIVIISFRVAIGYADDQSAVAMFYRLYHAACTGRAAQIQGRTVCLMQDHFCPKQVFASSDFRLSKRQALPIMNVGESFLGRDFAERHPQGRHGHHTSRESLQSTAPAFSVNRVRVAGQEKRCGTVRQSFSCWTFFVHSCAFARDRLGSAFCFIMTYSILSAIDKMKMVISTISSAHSSTSGSRTHPASALGARKTSLLIGAPTEVQ
jgi:hypothetical protein